ncbi:MAG: pentapeptide repeat-containing protein [Chlorobium sp.]|jgi:hypothetical protein|nr:pentapeptide repeat-containing protein [Chlorobium sp.]
MPRSNFRQLLDRNRAPRKWWYPVPKTDPRHRDVIEQLHENHSKTINKTMFSLLGVGLYCLLKVLGESDKSLIVANTTIQTPLVGTSISFQSFLLIAPVLLVILVTYLHILYGYWLQLERKRKEINEAAERDGAPTIESIPSLFSFPDRLPRLFTNLIFYWFVPLTLWIMANKAFALSELRYPLFMIASVVTLAMLFLQIYRCQSKRWLRNSPRWVASGVLLLYMVYVSSNPESLRRPLNLQREDLHGSWLQGLDMAGADMNNANLQGANLSGADLRNVNLQNANLQEADLRNSKLQGADLRYAKFQKSTIGNADFEGAELDHADFRDAKENDPNRFKAANNYKCAFFSEGLLSELSLSPTHNQDLERIGTYYRGGKIAYIFQPGDQGYIEGEQHGVIAAITDLPGEDKYTWDAAIKACDELEENGYNDWRLPSQDELNQLYLNRSAVGGFAPSRYWSSTEVDAYFAWSQSFVYGAPERQPQELLEWRVRPVRAF